MCPPIFHPVPGQTSLWPLAVGRPPGGVFLAGKSLQDWQDAAWAGLDGTGIHQAGLAWVAPEDARALLAAVGQVRLIDATGRTLAWRGAPDSPETIAAGRSSTLLQHPWDLLKLNELLVDRLETDAIDGDLSPAAHVEGVLVLGAGSRVLPGVFIEGKVVIGKNCKIGPNCYLRGHTAIGDGCHIGQSVEIKNCLIGHQTNVGHLSYVGDSVLGDGVNFGAGTNTSNLRHDGANHRSLVAGALVDTGRRKFGTIAGDGVHTGINTSIYPGRKLGPNVTTKPGEVVASDLFGQAV